MPVRPAAGARWLLLLAPLLGAQHCAPTAREVGGAVLMAAPVAFIAAAAALRLLLHLWRPLAPAAVPWRAWRRTLAGAVLLAALPLTAPHRDMGPNLVIAMATFGTTYLAFTLVAWRAWAARRGLEAASVAAPLVAGALLLAPALTLFVELVEGARAVDAALAWFVFPGYLGAVPGALLLALLAEVAWRRHRAGRRPSPAAERAKQ